MVSDNSFAFLEQNFGELESKNNRRLCFGWGACWGAIMNIASVKMTE